MRAVRVWSWYILCAIFFILPHTWSLRSLFDKTDLPRLADTDSIELYHLRSFPALLIETAAGSFSTQISGLALRSTSTNQVVVLEYKPKSFGGCFLPILEAESDGDYSLYWENKADLVYHDEIDTMYWQQSTFLAHINGIVYKNYIVWLQNYMQNNRLFFPQSICNSEREFNCHSYATTWETFLHDSLKVFAANRVRIHAIIPPRATELRLLSNSLPLMVRVERVEPVNPAMSNESFPEHRSRDFDDNPKEENDPSIITDERDNPAEDIEFIGGEDGLRRRITTLSLSSRRHLDYEETGPVTIDPSPSRDSANEENYSKEELEVEELPLVPMSEIVDFYQDLMSCMQEFQLTDFTNALKSCISSKREVYIHINNDKYYVFTPRYPFVYINEYLQEIPDPIYNDTTTINSIDSSILAFLLLISLVGCSMMLCKMNFLCCGLLSSSENKAGYHRLSHDSDDHNAMDESAEQGGALSSPPPLNSDASMSSHRHEASSPTQDSFVSRLWGTTNQRSPLGRLYDQGFSRASGGRNIVQANTRSRTSRKKYGDEWGYDQEEGVELIDYDN